MAWGFLLIASFCFISCEADEEGEISQDNFDLAQSILDGDIVFSTKATMNGVDKTLLESGCPTKFNFEWNEDSTMTLSLVDFTVGVMPFAVTFRCNTKFMDLNQWEKEEYTGSGWVKFQGTNGKVTSISSNESDSQSASGASVDGYLNVNTMEIEFIINYNMMNVRSECPKQTIDKSRIDNFEAEFEQYQEDLVQYKIDHGLA